MTPADFIRRRLAEIKACCDAATPSPWIWAEINRRAPDNSERYTILESAKTTIAVLMHHVMPWDVETADREFIARARTDLPALVAALEAALVWPHDRRAEASVAHVLGWTEKEDREDQ